MITGRILLVDDEPQIHRFLAPALTAAGFSVLRAETGAQALRLAAAEAPDLVLLDLGLPDIDGQDVLRQLRGFAYMPVIILSARDREAEKIAALDNGADDYIEKPFGLGELQARIRTALRHAGGGAAPAAKFSLGGLEIDTALPQATLDGEALALTKREHALLLLLARNQGKVLTHRQLLTALWGPAHTEDVAYLRVYVGQLRKKLGPALGARLKTEPGIGYRFEDQTS